MPNRVDFTCLLQWEKKGPIRYLFVVKYKKQEQTDISEAEMLICEAL